MTAEDLRLVKSVTPTTFVQGALATYTLSIDTSEYAHLSDLLITDTIPNGLCPIDDSKNWTSLAEVRAAPVTARPTRRSRTWRRTRTAASPSRSSPT